MANHASLIRNENAGKAVLRRGRNFIEFDNGDGSVRHVATIDPLHYGALLDQEIDTAWEADTGAWQWRNVKNSHVIHSRDIFNVGGLFQWQIGNEWVGIDPQSISWIDDNTARQQIAIKQAVDAVANDDWLTWTNAYKSGVSYSFFAHPKKLRKYIKIDNWSDLPEKETWLTGDVWFEAEFTITNSAGVELYLDGVEWNRSADRLQTSNRIEFRDGDGIAQWYADAPFATDANGDTIGGQYEVRRQGGLYFITIRISYDWMATAAYPVVIDPTFTDGYGGDVTTYKDNSIRNNDTDANYGAAEFMCYGVAHRGLIEFDLSSISADVTCNSATMYLYHYPTASGSTAATLTAYSILSGNAAWPEGSSTSAPQAGSSCWSHHTFDTQSWAGSEGLSTSGTDYNGTSIGSFSCNTGNDPGDEYSSAITAATVENWFGGSNTNYGILLIWTLNSINGLCTSDHATTGYRPVLVVDYTSGAADLEPSPADNVTVGESAEVGPLLLEVDVDV